MVFRGLSTIVGNSMLNFVMCKRIVLYKNILNKLALYTVKRFQVWHDQHSRACVNICMWMCESVFVVGWPRKDFISGIFEVSRRPFFVYFSETPQSCVRLRMKRVSSEQRSSQSEAEGQTFRA